MPFSWSGLTPPVARGLAKAVGLNPASAAYRLQLRYGRVPDERFIDEMWPALRTEWLRRDRSVTKDVALALTEQGLNPLGMPVRNHEQRLAFLDAIPLDETVKAVVLAAFLQAHESDIAVTE